VGKLDTEKHSHIGLLQGVSWLLQLVVVWDKKPEMKAYHRKAAFELASASRNEPGGADGGVKPPLKA
jgi:hypothetical protein